MEQTEVVNKDIVITPVVDNTKKYNVLLKFVNKLLLNIGKAEITDLTEFKDIDREDIIKDTNKDLFFGMESELFPLFNKKNSGYYRKAGNSYVLNCLRGLLKECGYEPVYMQKDICEKVNGRTFKRDHSFYSIKKI